MLYAMTANDALAKIDAYWCGTFGLTAEDLGAPGVRVVPHAGRLAHYAGAYAWRRGDTCMVSAPAEHVVRTAEALRDRDAAAAFHKDAIAAIYGDAVERIVGPAVIAYADSTDFRAADERGARSTAASSSTARRSSACTPAARWSRRRRTSHGVTNCCTWAS